MNSEIYNALESAFPWIPGDGKGVKIMRYGPIWLAFDNAAISYECAGHEAKSHISKWGVIHAGDLDLLTPSVYTALVHAARVAAKPGRGKLAASILRGETRITFVETGGELVCLSQ